MAMLLLSTLMTRNGYYSAILYVMNTYGEGYEKRGLFWESHAIELCGVLKRMVDSSD